MPFVFVVVGVLLLTAGVRGKSSTLFALVKSDFSGTPNYFEWAVAIFVVGAIGYIKELSTISRMFMFLVLAGLLYKNKQALTELGTESATQPTNVNPLPIVLSSQPTTVTGAIADQFNPYQLPF